VRRTRIAGLVAGFTLLLAACSAEATPDTSSTTTMATVTTTTTPTGRVTLTANGPAFILEGTRGPYVEALQHYLVCTGHGQPRTDGGAVSVDGVFGPITADAVSWYQAELRRIPTGDPDEETFASLARDCDTERAIDFEPGVIVMEVAGNAAPGDDDLLVVSGQDGQVLSIELTEGLVTITVTGADGSTVDGDTGTGRWEAELPATQDYRISVGAESISSYRFTMSTRSPNVVATEFGPMVLEADGVAIADFGDDPENTIAVVSLVLGEPFFDTGWQENEPGCTGINRHVTWLIQADAGGQDHPAALELDFSDLGGTPFFAQYAYRSYDLAALDPIAQGLTTAEGISLGSDLEAFTDLYGQVVFFDPIRGLTDFNEEMLAGFEPGEEPADRFAWYIGAGSDGCPDFQ
jgi:peptidoglycan hydrolase-like protein with peptidoglycan-binding domain